MKKNFLQRTFFKGMLPLCFLFLSANNTFAYDKFAGQTIPGDYEISDATSLQAIAPLVNAGTTNFSGFTFHQTADIDLTGLTWTPIGLNDPTKVFAGTFDGGNYKISNLTGTFTVSYVGLFGKVDQGAVLKNINLENVNITGTGTIAIGSLAGVVAVNCTVQNCQSSGVITADPTKGWQNGGLIGYLRVGNTGTTTITKCHSSVNISSYRQVGGLIGWCAYGDAGATVLIEDCYATGNVTCPTNPASSTSWAGQAGGFVGYFDNSGGNITVQKCYSTGNVEAAAGLTDIGGFVGYYGGPSTQVIQNCYATGTVNAAGCPYVGGFAGTLAGATTIQNCYATGAVTGGTFVGGLVGGIPVDDGATTPTATTANITSSVALNPSIVCDDLTFGAAVGQNLSTSAPSCYSLNSMTLPTGTPTGVAGELVSTADINTASNWWDNGSGSGYFSNTGVVPSDVWVFENNKLPVFKNPISAVKTTDAISNFKLCVAGNSLQILSEGVSSVQIFNAAGKLMLQGVVYANYFDVASLASGVYVVKASTTTGTKMAKIIK